MVFLEPPRSRVVDKRAQAVKAMARQKASQDALRLDTLNESQKQTISPFVSSVDAYCKHYSQLAKGGPYGVSSASPHPARPKSSLSGKLEAISKPSPSPARADASSAAPDVSAEAVTHRIRPSSANVSALSKEAPFRNQYTQRCAQAEEVRARLRAEGQGTSPITGLANSFYLEADVAASCRTAQRGPDGPSRSLVPVYATHGRDAAQFTTMYQHHGDTSDLSGAVADVSRIHSLGDPSAEPGGEVSVVGSVHGSPRRIHGGGSAGPSSPRGAGGAESVHNVTGGSSRPSSPTATAAATAFKGTMLGMLKSQVCTEADATFQHLSQCFADYHEMRANGGVMPMRRKSPRSTASQQQNDAKAGGGTTMGTPTGASTSAAPAGGGSARVGRTLSPIAAATRSKYAIPGKAADDGEEDYMLSLLVEAVSNESMRSVAEQNKTVLGFDPYKNVAVDFTDFAAQNCMLEFIGGQSRDVNGVHAHQLSGMSDTERHKMEALANQVRRGFSHKGFTVPDAIPIAIIFPTYDDLAANSADGKRPLDKKRLDVHTRCMLIGSLLLPPKGGVTVAQQQSAMGGANPHAHTTLGGEGATRAMGQLSAPHPFRSSSAFEPASISQPTLTTVTAEHHFKQQRRRETRDRIRANKALEDIHRKARSASVEHQTEAAIAAQREAAERAARPRTEEAILEEILLARRGFRLPDNVLDAITAKMQSEARPLRPMREIRRVQIPSFVEYRDCFVRPSFMVTYEVPNNRVDAPTRSTLDPSLLLTTRASLYDDHFPFDKLEYTMRWGLPIGTLLPSSFHQDCWVRKVIRVPESNTNGGGASSHSYASSRPMSAPNGIDSSITSSSPMSTPIPLGALLQYCGRGTVSIDVQSHPYYGYQHQYGAGLTRFGYPVANPPPTPSPHYRHSFMFTERGVAAIMKERRYGKGNRNVPQPSAGSARGK